MVKMECFVCKKTFEIENIVSHLKTCYEEREGSKKFYLTCVNNGCNKTFRTYSGLKWHMKNHISAVEPDNSKFIEKNVESFENESRGESLAVLFEDFETELHEMATSLCVASVPDTQQTTIIQHLSTIIEKVRQYTLTTIKNNQKIPIEAINISFDAIQNKITTVRSKYLRQKNYEKLSTFVAPVEKSLSTRIEKMHSSTHQTTIEKTVQCTFHYVPIQKTLKNLFKCEAFRSVYFAPKRHKCQSGIYNDVCCGSNVQQSSFFAKNSDAVMIELYYDEVEPCDALKQSRGVHKLGQFYFRIRNLDTHFQSKWDQIYLLASFYYADLNGKLKSEFFIVYFYLLYIFNPINGYSRRH